MKKGQKEVTIAWVKFSLLAIWIQNKVDVRRCVSAQCLQQPDCAACCAQMGPFWTQGDGQQACKIQIFLTTLGEYPVMLHNKRTA